MALECGCGRWHFFANRRLPFSSQFPEDIKTQLCLEGVLPFLTLPILAHPAHYVAVGGVRHLPDRPQRDCCPGGQVGLSSLVYCPQGQPLSLTTRLPRVLKDSKSGSPRRRQP